MVLKSSNRFVNSKMKLSEILLFITLLFVAWFGLKKAEQCDRKDELIIVQQARINKLEELLKPDSLEVEYINITKNVLKK